MKQSVVVRGSLSYNKHPKNFIELVVNSIRSWFDGELILSTWEGQEKYLNNDLDIDKVVYSSDPGSGPIQHWQRQVVSYQNGLSVSSGDEIMVTRTDMVHKINPFQFLNTFQNSGSDLKVFDNKLVVSNMMTIRPDSNEYPNTFRVCDWMQVGSREDIFKWSDILNYILNLDLEKLSEMNCTEKLWALSVLKNKYPDIIDIYDSSNIDEFAWDFIVNNFIVLDTKSMLGAINMNWHFQPEYLPCYLDHDTYIKLYDTVGK